MFDPDIAILIETWLHDQIPDSDVFPDGFYVFRRDRVSRGEGDALLVRYTLSCTFIAHDHECQMVWASINFGRQLMLVGGIYRCPQANIDVLQSLFEFLQTKNKQFSRIILAGDFNLPDIDWENVTPKGIGEHSRILVDIAFNYNLGQVVTSPTRMSSGSESLLYQLYFLSEIFTKSVLDVSITEGISNHELVVCDLSTP